MVLAEINPGITEMEFFFSLSLFKLDTFKLCMQSVKLVIQDLMGEEPL